jgi:hypothetical protein
MVADAKFTTITHNIKGDLDAAAAGKALTAVCAAGDLCFLQEMGYDKEWQSISRLVQGWRWYRPDDFPGQSHVVVGWRTAKFTALGTDSVFLAPSTFVGAAGAGPATLENKWGNCAHLLHKPTGQLLWAMAAHWTPTVDNAGRPAVAQHPKRVALHHQISVNAARWCSDRRNEGITLLAGDLNVDWSADNTVRDKRFPVAILGAAGMVPTFASLGELKTHGGRGIDWTLVDRDSINQGVCVPGSHRLIRTASDHGAVATGWRVKARKGPWPPLP